MNKKEAIQAAAANLKKSVIDIFELAYINNPVSLVNALRNNNLTTSVSPKREEVEAAIRRVIVMRDKAVARNILSAMHYNHTSGNPSSDRELWAELRQKPGDFLGLFNASF